jgi:hypothetical protein
MCSLHISSFAPKSWFLLDFECFERFDCMGKSFVAFGPGGYHRVDGNSSEHSRIHCSDYVLDFLLRAI